MITKEVKLSSKNQVVIPKWARQMLDLKPGISLLITVDPYSIRIKPKPKNWTKHMRGLGKEMWQDTGGSDKWIKMLRSEWSHRDRF